MVLDRREHQADPVEHLDAVDGGHSHVQEHPEEDREGDLTVLGEKL